MATITVNNTETQQIAREFLYKLDLNIIRDRIDPDESLTPFVIRPVETSTGLLQILTLLEAKDPTTILVTEPTETRAIIRTTGFSDGKKDTDYTLTLSGTNLKSGTNTVITGAQGELKEKKYLTENRLPSEIENDIKGLFNFKVRYAPDIDDAGNYVGNITWQSETASYSGFYFDDGEKNTFNYSTSLIGNLNVTSDGELSGLVNRYTARNTDQGSIDSSTSQFSLLSKAGITVNQKQEYSGSIDSLSFSFSEQSSNGESKGLSYKESLPNQDLIKALNQFILDEITVSKIAEAMLLNNDRITASGANTTINGYLGNDAIRLGTGNDTVQFTTALGPNNIDTIRGFQVGKDRIQISQDIFIGYKGIDNFKVVGNNLDIDDRILYNNKTGQLFYDADGSGLANAVQFAVLVGKPTLNASDIEII